MGIYSFKPKFQKFLAPACRILVRYKVHPTVINFLALIISFIGGVVFY